MAAHLPPVQPTVQPIDSLASQSPSTISRPVGCAVTSLLAAIVIGAIALAVQQSPAPKTTSLQQTPSSETTSTYVPPLSPPRALVTPTVEDEELRKARERDSRIDAVINNTYGFTGQAETLYHEYEVNEIAADQRHKGTMATVSGKVKDIGKDILGAPCVVLGGPGFLNGVQCTFAQRNTSAASLYRGESVTIRGRVKGKMGNVQLDDCSLR